MAQDCRASARLPNLINTASGQISIMITVAVGLTRRMWSKWPTLDSLKMCTVLAATSARAMRRLWPGRRRCPLGGWLLRASRVADTARRLMWSENALKMPRYSVSLCTCVCVCTVGIWSYVLGNIHFWTCPILWDPFHEHSECPATTSALTTCNTKRFWDWVLPLQSKQLWCYDSVLVRDLRWQTKLWEPCPYIWWHPGERVWIYRPLLTAELWNIVTFCGVSYSYWVIATLFSKL